MLAIPLGAIMRRPSLPLILRWAILSGYALLIALGHAGWHVVIDQGTCPAHGSHANHAESTRAVTRTICSHGHVHTHHAKHNHGTQPQDMPGGKHSPTHHEPHDQNHCSVCAVFSAPQTMVAVVELVFIAEEVKPEIEWRAVLVPVSQESLPTPRGPPGCA